MDHPIGFDEMPLELDGELALESALDALTGGAYGVETWHAYTTHPAMAEQLIENWIAARNPYTREETIS